MYFPIWCIHCMQNNFYNKSIKIFHVCKCSKWQVFLICSYYFWSQSISCIISCVAVVMNLPVFFRLGLTIVLNNYCSEQYLDWGQWLEINFDQSLINCTSYIFYLIQCFWLCSAFIVSRLLIKEKLFRSQILQPLPFTSD